MKRLLLIADDLTGALDSGVQFSEKGINTEILIRNPKEYTVTLSCSDECQVLIVDTETRHLTPEASYKIVYDILTQSKSKALDFTYYLKKTDSGLRGNIASELQALLDFAQQDVHFIPAYPKMNRITKDGIHYIDGLRVSDSVFGQDPFNPVKESYIPHLFPKDIDICLKEADKGSDNPRIIVYDAEEDQDIHHYVDKLMSEKHHYLAGCAALAEIIPHYLETENKETAIPKIWNRTLIFSGSLNDVTHNQIDYAQLQGIKHHGLSEIQKKDYSFHETVDGRLLLDSVKHEIENNDVVIVSVGTEKSNNEQTHHERETVGNMLGNLAYELIKSNDSTNIFVIGGDTAVSLIYQIDNPHLIPVKLIGEGIVLSQVKSDSMNFNLITKSGGFGTETTIIETINSLNEM